MPSASFTGWAGNKKASPPPTVNQQHICTFVHKDLQIQAHTEIRLPSIASNVTFSKTLSRNVSKGQMHKHTEKPMHLTYTVKMWYVWSYNPMKSFNTVADLACSLSLHKNELSGWICFRYSALPNWQSWFFFSWCVKGSNSTLSHTWQENSAPVRAVGLKF